MQAESTTSVDCVELSSLTGLIFQIRDDYMNLVSNEYSNNKGAYEDLTEGKFSFPIIHGIRADSTNPQLINILKQKTNDIHVKRWAIYYMEGTGSFKYTRDVLQVLLQRARETTGAIDGGRGKAGAILKILDLLDVSKNGPDHNGI